MSSTTPRGIPMIYRPLKMSRLRSCLPIALMALVDPKAQMVAVVWSAWPAAWVDNSAGETATFLGAVVKSLQGRP